MSGTNEGKSSKKLIPIIIGIVAVAAIVVLLVVFLGPNAENGHTAVPPIGEQPAPTEPPPGVAVEPPPPPDLPDIPGSGGTVSVNGETVFHFIPDETGVWAFSTSDNDGDPMLVIYNQYGVTIAEDDNSGDSGNAIISIEIEAGHQYTVHARFSTEDGTGSYTLTVEHLFLR